MHVRDHHMDVIGQSALITHKHEISDTITWPMVITHHACEGSPYGCHWSVSANHIQTWDKWHYNLAYGNYPSCMWGITIWMSLVSQCYSTQTWRLIVNNIFCLLSQRKSKTNDNVIHSGEFLPASTRTSAGAILNVFVRDSNLMVGIGVSYNWPTNGIVI